MISTANLRNHLATIEHHDPIDCAPSLGLLTLAAMLAARWLVLLL